MKKAITTLLLVLLLCSSLFAKTYYDTGDQVFTFRAGITEPAMVWFPINNGRTEFFSGTHLNLGGQASISYQGYISPRFALGGELGYDFNYSKGKILLTNVPITVKLTYYPVQTGRFDLALSANAGASFMRYDENKYFAPYLSLSAMPMVFLSDAWGIGLETGLTLNLEYYTRSNSKRDLTALTSMVPVTLSLAYRH